MVLTELIIIVSSDSGTHKFQSDLVATAPEKEKQYEFSSHDTDSPVNLTASPAMLAVIVLLIASEVCS